MAFMGCSWIDTTQHPRQPSLKATENYISLSRTSRWTYPLPMGTKSTTGVPVQTMSAWGVEPDTSWTPLEAPTTWPSLG